MYMGKLLVNKVKNNLKKKHILTYQVKTKKET